MNFHEFGPLFKTGIGLGMAVGGGRWRHRHGRWGDPTFWARGGWWLGERRTRRGDVKFAILEVLAERPRHGYDVIRELEARGGYRPSAGSVYPTLAMLEDEGCVTSDVVDGKRVYTITDAGRALLAQKPAGDENGDEPHEARFELRDAALRLGAAVWQAAREGDPILLGRVQTILDRARREIYALLGGDAPPSA